MVSLIHHSGRAESVMVSCFRLPCHNSAKQSSEAKAKALGLQIVLTRKKAFKFLYHILIFYVVIS